MSYIFRQVVKFFANIAFAFSNLIPKEHDLILFSAWFGNNYSDNPRYIFEYSLSQDGTKAFWISKNKKIVKELIYRGYPAAYSLSLLGVWLQLRAGVIVFSHSHWSEFNACLIGSLTNRVQAWHGAPLKKIGLDDTYAKKSKLHTGMKRIIFPYLMERFDLVLATGPMDAIIFRSAFNVNIEKVSITGYARNDAINFSPSALSVKPKNILYLPTLRGALGSEQNLFNLPFFDGDMVNDEMSKFGANLYIKLHPAQALSSALESKMLKWPNIHLIKSKEDIYKTLDSYDALITDYSSVFFDYLLSGHPIYMLPIDLELYTSRDREFYYPYNSISPSKPMQSWPQLINYIFLEDYPSPRHKELLGRVHKFADCNSAQRAYEAIVSNLLKRNQT